MSGKPFRQTVLLKPLLSGGFAGYYTVSKNSTVSLGIYRKSDPKGKREQLRILVSAEYRKKGKYYIEWDGKDKEGNPLNFADCVCIRQQHRMTVTFSKLGNNSTALHGPTVFAGYSKVACTLPILYGGKNLLFNGRWYNEAGAEVGDYIDLDTDPHAKISIMPWGAAGDTGGGSDNYTPAEKPLIVSHDSLDYVLCAAQGYDQQTFLFGILKDTLLEKEFGAGSAVTAGGARTYNWAIGIKNTSFATERITGVAINALYIWVAREGLDEIDVLSAVDGSYIRTISINAPKHLTYDSYRNRVMILRDDGLGNPTNVYAGMVNDATGELPSGFVTVTDFPNDKVAMCIDNDLHILYIAYGGANQQIGAWNWGHPSNPSGTRLFTIGNAGGLQTNPNMADKSFCFTDNTTPLPDGLTPTHISAKNGKLYVCDSGNETVKHFSVVWNSGTSQYDVTLVDENRQIPTFYASGVDVNDSNAVFARYMEFDRSTGLPVRNYRPQITADYFSKEGYNVFKYVRTFSNGKRFATMDNYALSRTEIVELNTVTGWQPTGVLLPAGFTGVLNNNWDLQYLYCATDYNAGATVYVRQRTCSLDGDGLPTWAAETTIGSFVIEAGDAVENADAYAAGAASLVGITANGLIIIKNQNPTPTAKGHLQAYDITDGRRVFLQWQPTNEPVGDHLGHIGPDYPDGDYFEISNGVNNVNEGGMAILGDLVVTVCNAENWHAGQVTIFLAWGKTGLAAGQWGNTSWEGEALEKSPLFLCGNANSFRVARHTDNSNKATALIPDESKGGGLGVITMEGLNTFEYEEFDLIEPPTSLPLNGVNLLASLTNKAATITDVDNIEIENAGTDAVAQTTVNRYNKNEFTLALKPNSIHVPDNTFLRGNIYTPAYSPTLKQYIFETKLCFNLHAGADTGSPTALFMVMDINAKIICQITLEEALVTGIRNLKCNDVAIKTYTDRNTQVNFIQQWQYCKIVISAAGCLVYFGNLGPFVFPIFDNTAEWNKPEKIVGEVRKYTSIDGNYRSISIDNPCMYEEFETLPAPTFLRAEAISKKKIKMLFDQSMNLSIAGFIPKANNIDLTKASISGSGLEFELTVVEDILNTDEVTMGYDATAGDAENEDTPPTPLATFSNFEVINSVPVPEAFARINNNTNASGGYSTQIESRFFDTQANKTLIVGIKSAGYVNITNVQDIAKNTFVFDKSEVIGNVKIDFYRCSNTIAQLNNKITVDFSGMFIFKAIFVAQCAGLLTVLPLDSFGKGTSTNQMNVDASAFTTTQDDVYSVAVYANDNNNEDWTPPVGYSLVDEDPNGYGQMSDKVYNSIQTGKVVSASRLTNSGDMVIVVCNYKIQ